MEARFERLSKDHPSEAWPLYYLGRARELQRRADGALEAYQRAERIDQGFARPYWREATILRSSGDSGRAHKAAARCVTVSPTGAFCLHELVALSQRAGDCVEMEDAARREIAVNPDDPDPYYDLSCALAAQGRATAAVELAMKEAEKRLTDRLDFNVGSDGMELAMLSGDFAAAIRQGNTMLDPLISAGNVHRLAGICSRMMLLYEETGDKASALALVDRLTPLAAVVSQNTALESVAFRLDLASYRAQLGGGDESDVEVLRRRFLDNQEEKNKNAPWNRPYAWCAIYALDARTPQDAKTAIDMINKHGSTPAGGWQQFWALSSMGHVYHLAGRERKP